MNCAELETLLCDYVDGTLGFEQKAEVERHLAQCATCTQTVRDAAAAVAFMERVAEVEPPPELITRILFERSSRLRRTPERHRGLRVTLGRLLEPVLQPRFAMGMAMTILSFSMLGRFAGINVRQLNVSDLDPVKVWESVDDRIHRTWARGVKFYESLRLVYEVRSRLRELTEEEEEVGAPRVQPSGPDEPSETRQESGDQTEPGQAPQDVPRGIIR